MGIWLLLKNIFVINTLHLMQPSDSKSNNKSFHEYYLIFTSAAEVEENLPHANVLYAVETVLPK